MPGTVQLVDVQGLFHGLHGENAHEIVLVPQPSDDPNDPLRWSQTRKSIAIFCAMTWCFLVAAMISGLSPAYLLIEADTGISVADLSTGNGILFLFLGWGTLLSQTAALAIGRRITLFISILLTVAVTVWTAYVTSRGEFFVNRIFLGIFASPQETLIEVVVGDLYFAHDRGFYMGAYSWTLWCGAFLCPVASGYVAESLGWRWIQYILACVGAGLAVLTFFGLEETMFYRPSEHHQPEAQEPVLEGEKVEGANTSGDTTVSTEKGAQEAQQPTIDAKAPAASSTTSPPPSAVAVPIVPSSRSYLSSLKMWGYRDPRQPSPFHVIFLPLKLLFMFPGIGFGGLLVGGILAWYNVVGGSLAIILGNAPYNFSTNEIGLAYLSPVVGVTIGCLLSGWAADILAIRMARKNNGVLEPEHRLWSCVIALVLHPLGCLLYGVGASYKIHWFGVVFGLGLIGVTLPMGANLAFTYLLDSYKEVAGEGLVSIILVRNMMGTSLLFSYFCFLAVLPSRHIY